MQNHPWANREKLLFRRNTKQHDNSLTKLVFSQSPAMNIQNKHKSLTNKEDKRIKKLSLLSGTVEERARETKAHMSWIMQNKFRPARTFGEGGRGNFHQLHEDNKSLSAWLLFPHLDCHRRKQKPSRMLTTIFFSSIPETWWKPRRFIISATIQWSSTSQSPPLSQLKRPGEFISFLSFPIKVELSRLSSSRFRFFFWFVNCNYEERLESINLAFFLSQNSQKNPSQAKVESKTRQEQKENLIIINWDFLLSRRGWERRNRLTRHEISEKSHWL